MLKRNHLTQCDLVSRQGDLISSGPGCDLTVNYVSSAAEQLLANLAAGTYDDLLTLPEEAPCHRCGHADWFIWHSPDLQDVGYKNCRRCHATEMLS